MNKPPGALAILRPEPGNAVPVDPVDVRPRLPGGLDDPEAVAHEVIDLLGKIESRVREAEHPYIAIQKRLAFSWPTSDVIVLAENYPAHLGGQENPLSVLHRLGSHLAIDFGQRSYRQPNSRSAAGSDTWLRLRSMRNSGGSSSRCRPDDRLDFIG